MKAVEPENVITVAMDRLQQADSNTQK